MPVTDSEFDNAGGGLSFELVSVPAEPDVPPWLAERLRQPGVPRNLIRKRYLAGETARRIGGGSDLVSFGGPALAPIRMCVDLETGSVVTAFVPDGRRGAHVNATLDHFSECIRAVQTMFPFYSPPDFEDWDEAADRVRLAISTIDETAFGIGEETYWEAFFYDVQMGTFDPEMSDQGE
ncbi:SUKH-4 family immunity protein [Jidongwangia harbinensis]|uniref:SUKH-4 family immunity protein n=1 Tax=Jidongwangia harbinensis TaxID=2878561 RepID=UPI001CD9BE74|nr:SUKH-4 family immunity protein [Jidongwangia harbinensis]MCA2216327.1 SUKH-4 family immunity protein [Jidongwangia harbinensis]MCA2217062.1 SUKH-4 family immunity protein [Jidongwangia harbinensis]